METRQAQVVACAPGREVLTDAQTGATANHPPPTWAGRDGGGGGETAGRAPALPLARRRQSAELPIPTPPAAASHPAPVSAPAPASVPFPATPAAGAASLVDQLVRLIGEESYRRYFERTARLAIGPAGLEIGLPSRFMAELVGRRFGDALREVARAVGSGGEVKVSFCVDSEAPAARGHDAPAGRRDRSSARPSESAPPETPVAQPTLARRRPTATPVSWYRLDDFVVGSSNRLAYEAAVRLTEDPQTAATKLSPLFIHGACGLGKTHLLQGIARRFKERHSGAVIRYTTGEAFTNEFIAAVRDGRAGVGAGAKGGGGSGAGGDRFRRAYRNVDLLLIDDVHFLANKQATQAELLHTFDAVDLSGARVVLASDGHPRQIRRFSDALVSRFLSGMVVRLDSPERTLRERIIALFAGRAGLPLDEAGIRAIADHAEDSAAAAPGAGPQPEVSIRELEGLVTRVEAVWRLLLPAGGGGGESPAAIGRILVERALGASPGSDENVPTRRVSRPVRVDHIISTVCHQLGIVGTDFAGRGRHPRVVLARAVVVVLSRRMTTASYPEIARAMGRPNHSTVITAFQRLQKQIEAGAACPLDGEFSGFTLAQFCDRLGSEVARTA